MHSNPKVQRLGQRITGYLDDLRALIKASEAEEQARQEIARLERALADAKAHLRNGTAAPKTRPTSPAREGDRRREPLSCRKGCGKVALGAQGRGAHERNCRFEAGAA